MKWAYWATIFSPWSVGPTFFFRSEPVGGGAWRPVTKLQELHVEWKCYIGKLLHQIANRWGLFRGRRHLHSFADYRQTAIRRPWSGAISLKTTSWRCFHSSQQMRSRRVAWADRGMLTDAVDSHICWTSATSSILHPILLQNSLAKGQPLIMWSAVSELWWHISQLSS